MGTRLGEGDGGELGREEQLPSLAVGQDLPHVLHASLEQNMFSQLMTRDWKRLDQQAQWFTYIPKINVSIGIKFI
jgi:hypothetical protein